MSMNDPRNRACGISQEHQAFRDNFPKAAEPASIAKDRSPVEVQLDRQTILLQEASEATAVLIDSIRPVMRYDPRESPMPETEKEVEPSCRLEQELRYRNSLLESHVSMLRAIRGTICL